jgi:hypothetical protein
MMKGKNEGRKKGESNESMNQLVLHNIYYYVLNIKEEEEKEKK